MRAKTPRSHRLFGMPQAPEKVRWAIEALAIFGAFSLLRGATTVAIWIGAPPDQKPWFQLVAGVFAVLAALGLWRARPWGRSSLLAASVATALLLISQLQSYLGKLTPHPERDTIVMVWAIGTASLAVLGFIVRWFWVHSPVREG